MLPSSRVPCQVAGREDVGTSDKYDNNIKRVAHQEFIDGLIADWTRSLDASEVPPPPRIARV